LNVRMISMIIL